MLRFEELNSDALGHTLAFLSAKDLARSTEVCKLFSSVMTNSITQDAAWKRQVEKHFPATYKKLISSGDCYDWQAVFKLQVKKEYAKLTVTQKKLIYAIKENDLEAIKKLNLSYEDFIAVHNGHRDFTDATSKEIKEHFYLCIILPHYIACSLTNTAPDPTGNRTRLFWTIELDIDLPRVKFLFEQGLASSQETYGTEGINPIHAAAIANRLDIIELLISNHGAQIDSKNKLGQTALHYAAHHGDAKTINYLLKSGLNIEDAASSTPLAVAASNGNLEAVKAFLDAGADATATSGNQDNTAIHRASMNGYLSCVKALLEHDKSLGDAKNKFNVTSLYPAAVNGHYEVVDYLLNQGVKLDVQCNYATGEHHGKTAIMRAVDNRHWRIVVRILNAGSSFPDLIAYLLSTDNNTGLAELLKRAPDRFSQDYKNKLLLLAASEGKHKIITCLLKNGAIASTKNEDGYQAIHIATMNNHPECVKALAQRNADLLYAPYQHDGRVDNGKTPLSFAHECNQPETVAWLIKKMPYHQLFHEFVLAIQNDRFKLAEAIIDQTPGILSYRNKQKKTLLSVAAELYIQAAVDLCYRKNTFEVADPAIYTDQKSHDALNKCIIEFNEDLQKREVPDVQLMLATQAIIRHLNSRDILPETKCDTLRGFSKSNYPDNTAKNIFCRIAISILSAMTNVLNTVTGQSQSPVRFFGSALRKLDPAEQLREFTYTAEKIILTP